MGEVATNVLGVCTPDMKFIFVFPGWEGSASDSRVLRDAISRPTRLRVPTGCYYLVDGGYTNGQGYLAPYRVPHIESKMRFWKKLYGIIFDMINKSGFAWNDSLKCIEVDNDEAWNTYVQHNKDADGWRGKQCLIYDRLKNIFGKDRATGRGSATPTKMMNEPVHHIDVNDDDEEVEVDPDHSASLSRSNQQNSASSSSRHRKRNADTDIQKEMAKAFGEMISEFGDQLKTITNSLVKGSKPRPDIAAELAKMDLSINDQIKALRLILEKASDERTFLTLDGAMRKAFVLLLLGAREL
ncbi:unnamed protein product [Prunus armeniaca]